MKGENYVHRIFTGRRGGNVDGNWVRKNGCHPLSQTTSDLSAAHVVSGAFLHGQVSGRPAVLAGGVTTIRKEESYDVRRNHPCPAKGTGSDAGRAGRPFRVVADERQPV